MGPALFLCVVMTVGACGGNSPFGSDGGTSGGDGGGDSNGSGDTATPCTSGADCASGLCIPSDTAIDAPKTCAGACTGAITSSALCSDGSGSCFPGWSHWSLSGSPPLFCLCNPFGETQDACNGQDDDCNGLLDEDGDVLCTAADATQKCEASRCVDCPIRCSGTCTDTTLDLANCGGCGLTCAGATTSTDPSCSATGCQTLDIIAPTRGRLHHPVVDATSVYFVDGDTFKIKKCPLAGCTTDAVEVAGNIGYPNTVGIDATSIYWSAEQRLYSCPLTGCATPTTIASVTTGYFRGFLLMGATMVIADVGNTGTDGRIITCPITGCPASPTVLASGLRFPSQLATDGTDLYFIRDNDATGPDLVLRCPLTGCGTTPTVIGTMPYLASPVVVAQGKVYFIGQVTNGPRQILACPTTGCTGAPEVIATSDSYASDLHITGNTLYWIQDQVGRFASCPLTGCTTPTVLATNIRAVTGVAMDATSYYFTSDGQSPLYVDGKLHRLTR